MLKAVIFRAEDFSLCSVPVPKGYPQSQTHAGIAVYKGNYILTTSPYPSIRRSKLMAYLRQALYRLSFKTLFKYIRGEYYENPLIYLGESGVNPATDFHLMQERPLMECPDPYYGLPAFNSDPDLFVEGDIVNVLNRAVYRREICNDAMSFRFYNRLFLIQGLVDGHKFKFYKNELLKETDKSFVSPCFCKYRGKYLLTYLDTNSYNDGKTFRGLFYIDGDSVDDIRKNEDWEKVEVDIPGFLPWHMSIFAYGNKLYSIIACVKQNVRARCWQYMGEFSEDLSYLYVYRTPLTDYASYRSAACVNETGDFVLYNTTVREKIKGGKSVDGREVIMAHMPFSDLLKRLRENEQR